MPFDNTTEGKLAPTLANLSYLLRHEELWPKKFQRLGWNYRHGPTCAIGLARAYWGTGAMTAFLWQRYDITCSVGDKLDCPMHYVKPTDVADYIDSTL